MRKTGPWFVLIFLCVARNEIGGIQLEQIEILIKQWAPLVWLSPEEKFMPSSVEAFLKNVSVADENGNILESSYNPRTFQRYSFKSLYLVTKKSVDELKSTSGSFLYGENPTGNSVPIYASVTYCPSDHFLNSEHISNRKIDDNTNPQKIAKGYHFHVSYWMFYPYNEGKDVCFLGKLPAPTIFSRCFGRFKKMGDHVGDWEHMSLLFSGKEYPEKLFLAVHDSGVYYHYDPKSRLFTYESQIVRKGVGQPPKFPLFVRVQGGHPVLFSATGSHGLWSSPGEYDFVRVPRLSDKNGYGVPWKTWRNVRFYHRGKSKVPDWMAFKGKWGNPKKNCLLFKKLGLCELTDGPVGLLGRRQDFYCWSR